MTEHSRYLLSYSPGGSMRCEVGNMGRAFATPIWGKGRS